MQDINVFEEQDVAWTPTPDVIERSRLTEFMRQVGVNGWDDLYRYSIDDVARFTADVLQFLEIKFDPPAQELLDTYGGIEMPVWLAGAGLNISQTCLDRWQIAEMKDRPALIWEGEESAVTELTYAELYAEVERCAAGFRSLGFKKGDAVGIHLPMMPETVICLLALARIGAIAVPIFSGYGVEAISSRLNAVQAVALITCDAFPRRGKLYPAHEVAREAQRQSPSVATVVVVSRSRTSEQIDAGWIKYDEMLQRAADGDGACEPTAAEDPLIILYTSGTTGRPKGIAHTHASFPIKAAQDMAFGMDVGRGTRICWYTDLGWMMGPWLIYGALINGGTVCLYDGAPDFPAIDRMWEFCARHSVEVLGISPTLVRSLAAAEEAAASNADHRPPHERHDLSKMRAFASSGEPWNPAPWQWLFEKVGDKKLPIINYSGGTEISGGILSGNPILPMKPCSFPAPCLGMDVDIFSENGEPVAAGVVGELVIKQPWIGMARGFWQETDRYLDTYWRRFENIWVHGDWALKDRDGHWFILGRSDDTLKVAGKRVGPAEVESLLVAHANVTEAAVIGIPDELKGTAMIAFAVAAKEADSDFEAELKALVAKDMGKPLAPSKIFFVPALPKTRNGKVMRRVIRSAFLGEDAGDTSSLENPEAIDAIARSNDRS